MSWFKRESPLRSSITKRLTAPKIDAATCFEAFRNHWSQVWQIIERNGEGRNGPFSLDGVTAVVNHLDQLVTLLLQETTRTCPAQQGSFLPPENTSAGKEEWTMGPILDYLLTESILDKLHAFSLRSGEFQNAMKLEQLKIYEVLVSHSHPNLLFQKPVVRPLLHLLSGCQECSPLEVEKRLIILLNTLCVCLSQHPQLLEVFFSASSEQQPARFLIFSLLIPFVHREGAIGQQARDALLLCMALSHRNENIGLFIAEHSNFCPVLATGLSGLYSALPRKLEVVSEDWHHFTSEDIQDMPALEMFLNSLEFCNAVIQVAHPLVREQLLVYIYQGFLLPVLGPALNQNSPEEVIATIAYLELCLRSLSEPTLIQLFLKFILCDSYEEQKILDTLVKRIEAPAKLCLVTMALFRTLLDLNCEDVILELVLKYLIPCTHVMVSQRSRVRDLDVYCQTAEKLLSLIPTCCFLTPDSLAPSPIHVPGYFPHSPEDLNSFPPSRGGSMRIKKRTYSTSSFTFGDASHLFPHAEGDPRLGDFLQSVYPSQQSSYQAYLKEAQKGLLACVYACRCWSAPYDGIDPAAHPKPTSHQSPPYSYSQTSSYFSETEPSKSDLSTHRPDINGHLGGAKIQPHRTALTNHASRNHFTEDNAPASVCSTSSSGISSADGHLDELPSLSPDSDCSCNGTNSYTDATQSKESAKSDHNTHIGSDAVDKTQLLSQADGFSSPDIGPFLNVLLSRLEMMMQNDVYTNLQLTGLISRLAMYPQPLIRSFLLNHTLVFQPSVRSLIQVLNTLKQKMDSYSTSVDNFEGLLVKAKSFLAAREERLLRNPPARVYAEATANKKSPQTSNSSEFQRGDSRRRSFTNFILRRTTSIVGEPLVESISDTQGYRYISKPSQSSNEGCLEYMQTRNAALCAVILEEFLMELAAITQEHALIQAHPAIFFLTL